MSMADDVVGGEGAGSSAAAHGGQAVAVANLNVPPNWLVTGSVEGRGSEAQKAAKRAH